MVALTTRQDFGELYNTHRRKVFALCRYLLNSVEAAEDATQEAFLKAQRAIQSYDVSQPFWNWLAGIASHHCIDILRRRTTESHIFEDEHPVPCEPVSGCKGPLGELLMSEQGQEVRSALAVLPDKYRVPLVLTYYNECSYDEIAEVMGITRNHVAVLIFRGKKELRRILSNGDQP